MMIDVVRIYVDSIVSAGRAYLSRLVCASLFLVPEVGAAIEFDGFYYKDPKVLEKRMMSYLRGENKGLLISYPSSNVLEEQGLERDLLQAYGREAEAEKVAQDVEHGISENRFYEVYMISEAIYEKEDVISYIRASTNIVRDDGFTDSFLGLCVLNVITPKLVVNERGEYDRESMKVLQEFLEKFTLSARKNSEDFVMFRDVEVLMLRRIASLFSKPK